MSYRTIPIHAVPAGASAAPIEPCLHGDPERLRPLLRALSGAVDAEFGSHVPTGSWLRELSVDADQAVVSLVPGLRAHGPDVAQAAFDTLRRLLRDTDIYVGTALH